MNVPIVAKVFHYCQQMQYAAHELTGSWPEILVLKTSSGMLDPG